MTLRGAATFFVVVACGLLLGGCAQDPRAEWVAPETDAADCLALAGRMGLSLRAHQSDRFILLSSSEPGAAEETGRFLDQAAGRFRDDLARAGLPAALPPGRLVWVCFNSYDALEAYGRQADGVEASWMDAFYSYRTNRVAVVRSGQPQRPPGDRGDARGTVAAFGGHAGGEVPRGGLNLRTATHELAHQLAFNCGLQKPGAVYAFWLTEGLATNFEADGSGAMGLGREDARYRLRLAEAKEAGRLIPLEQFVGMTELAAGGAEATKDAYAQAWGLFRYLYEHRREQLRRYVLEAGAGGEAAVRFAACFGEIGALEREMESAAAGR